MNRRFFIDPLLDITSPVRLSGSDANHIKNVLRLGPGSPIILFDGKGGEYEGRIESLSSDNVRVSVSAPIMSATESQTDITIAQGFLKDKKMDLLIRQLTELGITRWVPFFAERSVSRPNPKRLTARKARWEKIARESLKQCRRTKMPEITDTMKFDSMLETGKIADIRLIFWENNMGENQSPFRKERKKKTASIFAVIGPEGGFSSTEVRKANAMGFETAPLGPRILRAETAAIVAAALLQHFFGDL